MLNPSEISLRPRDRDDARAFALVKRALDHPPQFTHAVDECGSEMGDPLVVGRAGAIDQQAQAFEEPSTRTAVRKAALETTCVAGERFLETDRADDRFSITAGRACPGDAQLGPRARGAVAERDTESAEEMLVGVRTNDV